MKNKQPTSPRHGQFRLLARYTADALILDRPAAARNLRKAIHSHTPRPYGYCRVTRCRGEFLGSHRSVICSIGDVFGGCTRFCVISRVFEKPEICAARTAFFLDFCAKVKEETGAYSPGPPYGRIKKLPVRISVRTAKQWNIFGNFCSISNG